MEGGPVCRKKTFEKALIADDPLGVDSSDKRAAPRGANVGSHVGNGEGAPDRFDKLENDCGNVRGSLFGNQPRLEMEDPIRPGFVSRGMPTARNVENVFGFTTTGAFIAGV